MAKILTARAYTALAECGCGLGQTAAKRIEQLEHQLKGDGKAIDRVERAERQVRDMAREIDRLHRIIAELRSQGRQP
jgi:phage shock protein A